MTFTVGSWILPLAITFAAFATGYALTPTAKPSSYFPDFGAAVIGAICMMLSVIVSLAAWLIWALVL